MGGRPAQGPGLHGALDCAGAAAHGKAFRRDDAATGADRFWEFWAALLAKEQTALDQLKSHPGWEYRARRHGLYGGIEFQVYDRDGIEISGPAHDLPKLTSEHQAAVQVAAKAKEALPAFNAQKLEAQSELAKMAERLSALGKHLGQAEPLQQADRWAGDQDFQNAKIQLQAELWSAALKLALHVQSLGARPWLEALGSYSELESANLALRSADEACKECFKALTRATDSANKQVEALSRCADTSPQLVALASRLNVSLPVSLTDRQLVPIKTFTRFKVITYLANRYG